MPAISRLGDVGEGNCSVRNHNRVTTTFITGASTVFIENIPVTIIGTVGEASCRDLSTALTGSPNVFVENIAVHRIGDTGEIVQGTYTSITGAATVFSN